MIKLYTVLFLLLCTPGLKAQSVKQLPGVHVRNVVATNDGGYLITSSHYLLKYNAADVLLWSKKTTDTTSMQFIKAIAVKDNGYVVLGVTGSINNRNTEVFKLDSSLNIVWRKKFFGDNAYTITEDWSGNLLFSYTTGEETINSDLTKLDPNGNILWTKRSATIFSLGSYINCIRSTSNKQYIVSGVLNSNPHVMTLDSLGNQVGSFSYEAKVYKFGVSYFEFINNDLLFLPHEETGGSNDDAEVARVTSTGVIKWQKAIGTTDRNEYLDIAVPAGNKFLLAGHSSPQFGADSTIYISAITAAGKVLWVRTIPTPTHTSAVAAARLNNGNIILVAAQTETYAIQQETTGYIIKLDANGNTCSQAVDYIVKDDLPVSKIPAVYTMVTANTQTPKFSLINQSNISSLLICGGNKNAANAVNIEDVQITKQPVGVSVYPNPVSDVLNISFNFKTQDVAEIELMNLAGKKLLHQSYTLPASNSKKAINMEGFAAGIYILKVSGSNENTILKIVKH